MNKTYIGPSLLRIPCNFAFNQIGFLRNCGQAVTRSRTRFHVSSTISWQYVWKNMLVNSVRCPLNLTSINANRNQTNMSIFSPVFNQSKFCLHVYTNALTANRSKQLTVFNDQMSACSRTAPISTIERTVGKILSLKVFLKNSVAPAEYSIQEANSQYVDLEIKWTIFSILTIFLKLVLPLSIYDWFQKNGV